jgi:hypothetical protein
VAAAEVPFCATMRALIGLAASLLAAIFASPAGASPIPDVPGPIGLSTFIGSPAVQHGPNRVAVGQSTAAASRLRISV